MNKLRLPLSLVTAILLLSGCETVRSNCPQPKEYTVEQLDRAATELEAMPVGSMVVEMIEDYGLLRDQVRVCE